MAVIRPFKGIRPIKELANKIAALPYDVMDSDEAREMVKGNPYSFLHVDKAEIDLPNDIDAYDDRVYEKAKENLDKMIEKGYYIEDEKPKFYIYRQVMKGRSQVGLVGCASIDDYTNNIIKKHELTREDKEIDRINHVYKCEAHTGPIFLTYRANKNISNIINEWMKKEPVYDFKSEDGVSHTVWIIEDECIVNKISELFKSVEYLYIADGHHRSASAVKVGHIKRAENEEYTGDEEFNYFLSISYPDSELEVLDYNRTVKDLNGLSKEEFLNKVSENFIVTKSNEQVKPKEKHTFGMYLEKQWYLLEARNGIFNPDDPVDQLDVSILQNNLLKPILGIDDPRKSKRIKFVGGIRGLRELERRADTDMKVSFSMYATTTDDIMDIADSGRIMPPKSTWFEPKPRSGLFIHKF
ncbi:MULTISPECIES: DUF1015 domain-containing protein [Clostridium]|jgi:uncharacterized protein (DUF1015 family)|uniref:DUF1015 family protein n=1 Tax=Clostridium tertium TaxID=1559 RepID=A0A9X3XQC6_9CLOT|nr:MULTISPECIES: DUF1015 family protein [Clostridium]EEH99763.1 hypothetical protein CSBG_03389 [Clostridium sp. 7_2_43FAA]MBP1869599.1 uncharacterized protein (DUF1015 family) [Clostridium tertium]MDB1941882.1 DUF1015 family protein [Clostridium tertium]MDB1949220.1 DUF1015 family protein [Clostridium tertium]MDB1956197.1 DUF1015 family protein [Clostridium tertium]